MTPTEPSATPAAAAVTAEDAVTAASAMIGDLTAGTLAPADIQRRAVATARSLFGVVGSGPADPLWQLHGDVARQYLAAGGVSAAEQAEWLAVQRAREGIAEPDPDNDTSAPISSASDAHSAGNDDPSADAAADVDPEPGLTVVTSGTDCENC